ncbi:hypothetical protein BASA61_004208 [Batrachochytrium salamandrivorans]|nr:hypothetical protein BASA61_004208 [Batrachochytrium salamandrivorans]
MPAPLLNEYKAAFVARRFLTTLSGGPSLAPADTPKIHVVLVVGMSCMTLFMPFIGAGIVLYSSGEAGCALGALPSTLSAFDFVFNRSMPSKVDGQKYIRFFKGIFAGVFSCASLAYLVPSHIASSFGTIGISNIGLWVAYTTSWIACSMAHWSLVGPKPSEFNTYQTEDLYHIDDFSRAVHVSILLVLWGIETAQPSLINISTGVALVFALLPIIWPLGFLPSARVLFVKLIELGHTLVLGGPALISTTRMGVVLFGISIPVAVSTVVCIYMGVPNIAIVVAALGGCISSSRVYVDTFSISTSRISPLPLLTCSQKTNLKPSIYYEVLCEWAHLLSRLILTTMIVAVVIFMAPVAPSTQIHPLLMLFFWVVCTGVLILKATREMQQIYIPSICPIFRNPLRRFPVFRRVLDTLGCFHLSVYHLVPLASVGWISSAIIGAPEMSGSNISLVVNSAESLKWVWYAITMSRCLTLTWHRSEETAIDICIVSIVSTIVHGGSLSGTCRGQGVYNTEIRWCALDLGTQLLLVSFVRNTVRRLRLKTTSWILGVKHFLMNKKQRHPSWMFWIIPIGIISPISILVSAILDTPTMSFLGLPLLIVGFPRPVRMWASIDREYSSGQESAIYSTMAPSLMHSVSHLISRGAIPAICPGDMLLARIESRLLLLRGIETWFEGVSVIITGTELEPTSCHALEGAEVDFILDNALIFDGTNKDVWLNRNVMHTLLPVGMATATSYVESKMTTTGILDNPDILAALPSTLFKVLVFSLMRKMNHSDLTAYHNTPVSRNLLQTALGQFPHKWFEYLKKSAGSQFYHNGFSRSASQADRSTFDEMFKVICVACYIILLGKTTSNIDKYTMSTSALFDMYAGSLPYSVNSECRSWWVHPLRIPLRKVCIQAMRYAVKLLLDNAIHGHVVSEHVKLEEQLDHLAQDWVVTMDTTRQMTLETDPTEPLKTWQKGIEAGIPNFFGLFKLPGGPISVRMLVKRPECAVRLGIINGEAVRGIWSNLVFELLYLTNDDDERYSIQAHELLLRNLTVQAAPPPFGYPLWVSAARLGRSGLSDLAEYLWRRKQTRSIHNSVGRSQEQDTQRFITQQQTYIDVLSESPDGTQMSTASRQARVFPEVGQQQYRQGSNK